MRTMLKALVVALPVTLFAGSIPITDTTVADTVTTSGNQIQLGQVGNCSTTCSIGGTGNSSGFLFTWVLSTNNPILDSGSFPSYTITSGGSGSFAANDLLSGGGDSVLGSINLQSVTEAGFGMTIFGTLTVPSIGGVTLAGNPVDSLLFQGLLAQGGITPAGGTASIAVDVINCTKGGLPSVCIQAVEPVGSVSTVTVASSSGVPEPGTFVLFAVGLGGLAWKRRWARRA